MGRRIVVALVVALATAGCLPVRGLMPQSAPPRSHPLRVLLLGDGVMFDAEPGIAAAFGGAGARVSPGSMWGYGLTHPEVADFRTDWPARIASADPDLVIVLLGPWDIRDDTNAQWRATYDRLLDEAAAILTAEGAEVWWLPMLPEPGTERGRRIDALAAAVAALDARRADVLAPDVHAAFLGPDGRYTAGPDPAHPWRKPDGEHLCPAGVVHLVDTLGPTLASRFGARVAPGWERGAWTNDARYRFQTGNACPA